MDTKTRPQYYDGQYLGAADLDALVRYARGMQAQHTLGAHLWGIGIGLEIIERPLAGTDVEMVLTPGIAWDGYGRAIVALAPQRLSLEQFVNFPDTPDAEGIPVGVWLTYRELPASPPGVGFACPEDVAYGQVVETFRIELRQAAQSDTHILSVANQSIDALNSLKAFDPSKSVLYDESVPHQAFPQSGTNPRWPVFVGIVRWKKLAGGTGSLITRTDVDRNQARQLRRYIGTVAETIMAADGVLRLRDRTKDPADVTVNYKAPIVAVPSGTTVVNDLVWCEGHLRVVGDARLQPNASDDGKLDYRVKGGGDDGIPMYLRRVFAKAAVASATIPKTTLDAYIGPPPAAAAPGLPDPQTRFTVSSLDAQNKPKECLTVVTTARVGVNEADPTAHLHIHSDDATQGDIQLFSKTAEFEYDGGGDKLFTFKATGDAKTAFMGGDIGVGISAPTGKVHVHSDKPQQGDIQLFSQTADFEYDGGSDKMFVFKTGTDADTVFAGRNIGVGATAPTSKLHVHSASAPQGDIQLFSATADFEYDGGSDHYFVFRASHPDGQPVSTAILDTNVGVGLQPTAKLHVQSDLDPNFGDIQLFPTARDGDFKYSGGGDHYFVFKASHPDGQPVTTEFSGGDVGIGVVPTARLHVHSDDASQGDIRLFPLGSDIEYDGGTDRLFVFNHSGVVPPGGTDNVTSFLGGRVGIGTTSPSGPLEVAGDAYKNSGIWWSAVSDATLKTDIKPIKDSLGKLLALSGKSYAWRDPAQRGGRGAGSQLGFIAQEVEAVFPEWIRTTPEGVKAINPVGLEALFVEALREVNAKCERLEAEVAALRARVEKKTTPSDAKTSHRRARRKTKAK